MDYRGAVPSDLQAVRALLEACDLPTNDVTGELLRGFLVAVERGALVGCVGLEPIADGALLRSLAVDPSRRGRGIAARLCEEVERSARSSGVRRLHLLTTTAAGYFAARGFEPVPRESLPESVRATAQFRVLCPSTAVAMRKALSPDPS